jgi:hypothetical protein
VITPGRTYPRRNDVTTESETTYPIASGASPDEAVTPEAIAEERAMETQEQGPGDPSGGTLPDPQTEVDVLALINKNVVEYVKLVHAQGIRAERRNREDARLIADALDGIERAIRDSTPRPGGFVPPKKRGFWARLRAALAGEP